MVLTILRWLGVRIPICVSLRALCSIAHLRVEWAVMSANLSRLLLSQRWDACMLLKHTFPYIGTSLIQAANGVLADAVVYPSHAAVDFHPLLQLPGSQSSHAHALARLSVRLSAAGC